MCGYVLCLMVQGSFDGMVILKKSYTICPNSIISKKPIKDIAKKPPIIPCHMPWKINGNLI